MVGYDPDHIKDKFVRYKTLLLFHKKSMLANLQKQNKNKQNTTISNKKTKK